MKKNNSLFHLKKEKEKEKRMELIEKKLENLRK